MVVEELLQLLVGEVDAQLLKAVVLQEQNKRIRRRSSRREGIHSSALSGCEEWSLLGSA